ncbi:MAG: ATP synthase F1 subunit epsilon [Armatimonadetes bacterium]|nr:ATP synthase F1 subunit epsilon [Armatimonadota bacterium]
MDGHPFSVEIVTPTEQKFSGEVTIVTLPGVQGEMGILAGHAPLLAMLDPGEVKYRNSQGEFHIAVGEGFATVAGNKVVCLVDFALEPSEISVETARLDADRIEKELEDERRPEALDRLRQELKIARAKVKVGDRQQ